MLVGFLVEGWDYLILRAYLAKLLERPEEDLEADPVGGAGSNWKSVIDSVDTALRRFYGQCAQVAVIGVDNDGSEHIRNGVPEDARHPRHWLHPLFSPKVSEICRWCQLEQRIEQVRAKLTWLPRKPGNGWPVLISVPVEAIEAWLLTTQALVHHAGGSLNAEDELRHDFKQRLYGRPAATRVDVETIALPLVRSMLAPQLEALARQSRSFRQFSDQVEHHRPVINGETDCW